MKRAALSIILALTMSSALACPSSKKQRGQTKDINFSLNSSAINNVEILSLANWIVDTRSQTSALEGVAIIGLADKREHSPRSVATDRAEHVKQALTMFGVRSATIVVIARVYEPMMPNDKYEPTGTRVEVTLIPACAD